ncbi:hypothetical protein B0H11DRAFT_2215088 [Mycena galericulata]|nr:hypothetical protein B0H11DRAFT_2215088 [Mycena galericulata]
MADSDTSPLLGADSQDTRSLTQYQLMVQKRDEQRRKTRERMVRYAADPTFMPTLDLATEQASLETQVSPTGGTGGESAANRIQLMVMSRARRIEEFGHKYGMIALEEKFQRSLERKQLKIDKIRRKSRIAASGKPVSNKRRREPDTSSSDEAGAADPPCRPHRHKRHHRVPRRAEVSFDEEEGVQALQRHVRRRAEEVSDAHEAGQASYHKRRPRAATLSSSSSGGTSSSSRGGTSSSSSSPEERDPDAGPSRPARHLQDSSSDAPGSRRWQRRQSTLGRVRRARGTPTPGVEYDKEGEDSSSDSSDADAPIPFPYRFACT